MKSLVEQKRIARLEEVREQEREAAAAIREKVKKRREKHLEKVTTKLRRDFEANKENHIQELEEEYNRRIGQLGTAHALHGLENYGTKIELSEKAISEAQRRYKKAYTKQLHEQNIRNAPVRQQGEWRNKVQKMETERKEQILALPKPAYDVIANLKPIRVGGLPANSTRTSHETFMNTRFHLGESNYTAYPEVGVERVSVEEQDDARQAAIDQETRRLAEKEKYDRQIEERKEKAEIRHQYARNDVILKQEKNTLMDELKVLEFHDRNLRCETVKNIPKKVFQPPYQRLADVNMRRMELEHAFENIYNVNIDNIQELTLPGFVEVKDDLSNPLVPNQLQDLVKPSHDPVSPDNSIININAACTEKSTINKDNAAKQDTSQLVPVAITRPNKSRIKIDRSQTEPSSPSSIKNYVHDRLTSLRQQQRVNQDVKAPVVEGMLHPVNGSDKSCLQVDADTTALEAHQAPVSFDIKWTNDHAEDPRKQTSDVNKKDLSVKWRDEISQVDVFVPDVETIVPSPSTTTASESCVTDFTMNETDVTTKELSSSDVEEEPLTKELIIETEKTASLTQVTSNIEVPSQITSKSSDSSWSLNSSSLGQTAVAKGTTQKDYPESSQTNSSDMSFKSMEVKTDDSIVSGEKKSDESTLSVDRPLSKTMMELQNVRAKKQALRKDYSALIEKMQSYRKELRAKGEQFRKKEAEKIRPPSPHKEADSLIEANTLENVDVLTSEALTENSIIAEPTRTSLSMQYTRPSCQPASPAVMHRMANLTSHDTPHPASSAEYDPHEQSGAFSSAVLDLSRPEIDFDIHREENLAPTESYQNIYSEPSNLAVLPVSDRKRQSNLPNLSGIPDHREQSNVSPLSVTANHLKKSYLASLNVPDLDTTTDSDISSLNLNPQRKTHELLDGILNDNVDSKCARTSTRQQGDNANIDSLLRPESDSLRSIESLTDRANDLQPGYIEYLTQSNLKEHDLVSNANDSIHGNIMIDEYRPSSYNSSGIVSLQEQRLSSAADCSTDSNSDSDVGATIDKVMVKGPTYDMLLPSSSSYNTLKLPPLPPLPIQMDNPRVNRIITPTDFKPLSCVPSPVECSLMADTSIANETCHDTSPKPDSSSIIPEKTHEWSSHTSLHAMLNSLVSGDSSSMLSLREQRMSSAAGYIDSSYENGSDEVKNVDTAVDGFENELSSNMVQKNNACTEKNESPFVSVHDNMQTGVVSSPKNLSTDFFTLNEFSRTVIDTTCGSIDDNIPVPTSITSQNPETSFAFLKEINEQVDRVENEAHTNLSDLSVPNRDTTNQSTLHLSHLDKKEQSLTAPGLSLINNKILSLSPTSHIDKSNEILLDKSENNILKDSVDDISDGKTDLSHGLAQLTLNIKELASQHQQLSIIDLSLEDLDPNEMLLDNQSPKITCNNSTRVNLMNGDSSKLQPVQTAEVLSPEVVSPETISPALITCRALPQEVVPQEDLLQNITSQDDFIQKYLSPKSSPDNQLTEEPQLLSPSTVLPEISGYNLPEDPLGPSIDSFAPLTNMQDMSLLSQEYDVISQPASEPDTMEIIPEKHSCEEDESNIRPIVNLLSPSVDMLNPEESSANPVEFYKTEATFKPIEIPTIKIQSPSVHLLAQSSSQLLSPSCSFLSDEYEEVLRNMSPDLIKVSSENDDEEENVIPGFHGTLKTDYNDLEHYSPGSLVITNTVPDASKTNRNLEQVSDELFKPIALHEVSPDSDQSCNDVLRKSHEMQSESMRLKEHIEVINQLSAKYREEQKKLAESYEKLKMDLLNDETLSTSASFCNEDIRESQDAEIRKDSCPILNGNEAVSSEYINGQMCSTFLNPEVEANSSSLPSGGDKSNQQDRQVDLTAQPDKYLIDDNDSTNHSKSSTSVKDKARQKYLSMFDGLATPDFSLLSKSVVDNETIPLNSITENSFKNLPILKKYLESIRSNDSRTNRPDDPVVTGNERNKDRDTEATTISDELSNENEEQRNRFLMSFFQGASPDITIPDISSTDLENFSIFDFTQISYRNLPKGAENKNENDTSQNAGSSLDADIDKGIRAVEEVFNRHKHDDATGRLSESFCPHMDSPTYVSFNNKSNVATVITPPLSSDCTMSELTNLKLSSFSNDLIKFANSAVPDASLKPTDLNGSKTMENPVTVSSSKLSKSDSDTSELFTVGKLKLSSQGTRNPSKKKPQRLKGVARESLNLAQTTPSIDNVRKNVDGGVRKNGDASVRKNGDASVRKKNKDSSSSTSTCTDESLTKKLTSNSAVLQNNRTSVKKRQSSTGSSGGGLKKTKQGLVIPSQKGGKKQVKFK